jgi:hypothetical protein
MSRNGEKILVIRFHYSWAPVAHAYNPSYSGGRDQADHVSKSAPQIVSMTLSQKKKKKKHTRKG